MEINLTLEELAKKKVFVATPMYGGMCGGMYTKSMCDLTAICTRHNVSLQFFALFNESLITRARNYCVDEFLRSQMDHLLFLDADIGFDPNDIVAMLGLQTPDSPYDILCAPYPKKCISWEKIKQAVDKGFAEENPNVLDKYVGDFVFNPKNGTGTIPLGEPCEILEGGTGFMMIRRPTLEKFREAYPEIMYRPDHVRTEHFDGSRKIGQYFQAEIDRYNPLPDIYATFETIKKGDHGNDLSIYRVMIENLEKHLKEKEEASTLRYLSEDYWFSQKCNAIGLRTWLCPWMKTNHSGTMIYGGSLVDLAQIGASPTADVSKLNKKTQ